MKTTQEHYLLLWNSEFIPKLLLQENLSLGKCPLGQGPWSSEKWALTSVCVCDSWNVLPTFWKARMSRCLPIVEMYQSEVPKRKCCSTPAREAMSLPPQGVVWWWRQQDNHQGCIAAGGERVFLTYQVVAAPALQRVWRACRPLCRVPCASKLL